jgi:hypothetical protein
MASMLRRFLSLHNIVAFDPRALMPIGNTFAVHRSFHRICIVEHTAALIITSAWKAHRFCSTRLRVALSIQLIDGPTITIITAFLAGSHASRCIRHGFPVTSVDCPFATANRAWVPAHLSGLLPRWVVGAPWD